MSRWPSPAKLNLFLYITGQRADGYHTLQTLFQFLDYGDTLTIEPRADGELRLLTPVAGVPDEENLIIRAARLLMRAAGESGRLPAGSGADISIDKRLPMGGGLGAARSMPPPCWWRLTISGAAGFRKMSWRPLVCSWGPMCRSSCAAMPPLPREWVKFSRRWSPRKNGTWWLIQASVFRRRSFFATRSYHEIPRAGQLIRY